MENNVTEVNFGQETIKEDVKAEINEQVTEITQEMIMGKLDGIIQNHLKGIGELVQDENFVRINKEFDMNLVGIVSVFVTQIANQVGANVQKPDLMEKAQVFVEGLAVEYDMHPADVTAMMLKVFSDILLQVVAAEELGQELNAK